MTLLSTVGAPHARPSKEISHRDHSKLGHRLTPEPTGQAKFKCNGCLEEGTGGDRYTCKPCNFDLHEACNLEEGTTLVHPLLPKSTFELHLEAPRSKERCSACGTHVQGIHYHCGRKDLYLHPCCAMLPMEIKLSDELKFELHEVSSNCCTKCGKGGGLRDYWFYRSTSNSKKVYLHVGCAREVLLLPSSSSTESHVDGNGSVGRYVNETALQKRGSGKAGRKLDTIFDIMKALASIVLAVITGNPAPLIAVGIDLCSFIAKLKTR